MQSALLAAKQRPPAMPPPFVRFLLTGRHERTTSLLPPAPEDDAKPDETHNGSEPDSREAEEAGRHLVGLIGARLAEARRLSGMAQLEASKRLGYQNSSRLSKIEAAGAIQLGQFLPVLIQCARMYGVPTDYLLGLTADPDPGAETQAQRAILTALRHTIEEHVTALTSKAAAAAGVAVSLREDVGALVDTAMTAVEAVARVRRLNPAFDETIRGGAKMASTIDAMSTAAVTLRDNLRRFDARLASITAMAADDE